MLKQEDNEILTRVGPGTLMGELLRRTTEGPELTWLDAAIAWTSSGLEDALRLAASLRMFGMRAVVDTQPRSLAAALAWREAVGARHLLHLAGSGRAAWTSGDRPVRRLPADQVIDQLASLPRAVGGVPGGAGGGGL